MKTNNTHRKYFQSKINKDLVERFETEESIIGFDHANFKDRIRGELAYIGLNYDELASKCYINPQRMQYLMLKNVEFLPNEIASIKKILGM